VRRRHRRPGRAAGAEDRHRLGTRHAGFTQCGDHSGRIRVVGAPAVIRTYQRIGGTKRGGDRLDEIGDRERHLLEGHGQRQPAPFATQVRHELGQLDLRALDRGVEPVVQARGSVAGVVQHRRERVRNWFAEHRGSARFGQHELLRAQNSL
jgi:hypothetical protein